MTSDPYAYLEDGNDPGTIAWQEEQNRRTRAALDALPHRDALRERFDALTRTGWLGAPVERGGRTFFAARTGAQDQPRLLLAAADGEDRVLLDPAALDPTGLTALDWWYPSPQGRYVAYGLSRRGDEMSTLYVLDVASDAVLADDTIDHARWASVAWLPDETGFYYTWSPVGSAFDRRVRVHRLGTPASADRIVFGEGGAPEDGLSCRLSADGRWLVVGVHRGWSESEVHLADLASPDGDRAFVAVASAPGVRATAIPSSAGLVVQTTEDAPTGRVFLVDPERPERAAWREFAAATADALHFAVPTAAGVLLGWLHDVSARLVSRGFDGRDREIPLGIASIDDVSASEDSAVAYVASASFFQPATVRRIELAPDGHRVEVWRALDTVVDPARYDVRQTWSVSKDGTRVPIFVLAHRDTPRDGTAPAIVYGYGGFDVAITPSFSPSVVPWLDAGGVYAIANLRGGSEFGEAWHLAGSRERKQNVFDDYAAAFEHLAREGYADPARMAALGGSNGGLLVAALATQRPELARAIVCLVPVIDMLRYHLFSIGRLWIPEYGDPDVPDDAAFLRAYSPYENVRPGTAYPAMLVVSAVADSRVDPMHARKFVAKVRASGEAASPSIFAFIESDAGHGQGKPRHKQLDELVDRYAFVAWQLGVNAARLAGVDAASRAR